MNTPSQAEPKKPSIPVRKMNFEFEGVPKDYLNGNLAFSNFFNGLNLLFPEGERFFMRAVRDGLNTIKSPDPELKMLAKGFFGQETQHAIEHEKFFDILEQHGYQFRQPLAKFDRLILNLRKKLPASLRLAMTAGAEHLTAILGQTSLTDPDICTAHPKMRDLIQWHAIEEIEHKSVAYDVYQEAYGSYFLRIFGYLVAVGVIGYHTIKFGYMFMEQDEPNKRLARQKIRQALREKRKTHNYLVKDFFKYFNPSFHPTQIEDEHLVAQAQVDLSY